MRSRKKKNICRNLKREAKRLKESENILKVKVKTLTSKLRGKSIYNSPSPSPSSVSSSDYDSSRSVSPNTISSCEERTPLAKQIFSLLSPGTKRKTKRALSINKPVGFSKKIRTELGINIHKTESLKSTVKSVLCKEVEKFFQRPDVTKICADKKKTATDPHQRSRCNTSRQKSYPKYFKKVTFMTRLPCSTFYGYHSSLSFSRLVDSKTCLFAFCFRFPFSILIRFDFLYLGLCVGSVILLILIKATSFSITHFQQSHVSNKISFAF